MGMMEQCRTGRDAAEESNSECPMSLRGRGRSLWLQRRWDWWSRKEKLWLRHEVEEILSGIWHMATDLARMESLEEMIQICYKLCWRKERESPHTGTAESSWRQQEGSHTEVLLRDGWVRRWRSLTSTRRQRKRQEALRAWLAWST